MAAQHLDGFKDQSRFDVDLAIAVTGVSRRISVVELIGVKDDDLAARARFGCAAVVEGLDTTRGHTDSVGIVAVPVIRRAPKPRFQVFDPILRACAAQPIAGHLTARSFKTDAAGLPTMALHTQ